MISAEGLAAGKASIELQLLDSKLTPQLREIRSRLQTQLSGVMAATQSRVMGIRNAIASIGRLNLGSIDSLRALFIGSAAGAAAAYPVKLAANMELASAQMDVFTGSGEKSRALLLQLQQFSSIAAQSFHTLATQTRLLMTRGIGADEAFESIKALAVLAAGSEDEFQQLAKAFADVRSAGRLNGEEMRQFKNTAFNPFVEIAKKTGETMAQLKDRMEAGGVSFGEVRDALLASVRAGGLFHGMLDKIAGTLIGKMRVALAQFQLAIMPIGEELLSPLENGMDSIIGLMPAFADFIKAHSSAAKVVLQVIAGVSIAAVVFTTLGLTLFLASTAATGFGVAWTLLTAVFMAIVSPLGIVVAAMAALYHWFPKIGLAMRSVGGKLADWFQSLAGIATETFRSIADALTAGDIPLAANVMWAGLQLAWISGTHSLLQTWRNFADAFRLVTLDMLFDAMRFQNEFASRFASGWMNIITKVKSAYWDFWEFIESVNSTEEERLKIALYAAKQKGALANDNAQAQIAIEKDLQAAQRNTLEAERTGREVLDRDHLSAIQRAEEDLRNAKKALSELQDKAAEAAKNPAAKTDWFKDNFQFGAEKLLAGIEKAAQAASPQSFFDSRLARQMVGAGDAVAMQQLETQRKIERNTRRGGGGLPFV